MNPFKVTITEQPPVDGGTVLCEIKIGTDKGDSMYYNGPMYFTRDKDMNVVSYPSWLKHDRNVMEAIKNKGYKL